jgi:hypothetical protein
MQVCRQICPLAFYMILVVKAAEVVYNDVTDCNIKKFNFRVYRKES